MRQIKTRSLEHTYANTCANNIMQRSNPQDDVINIPPKVKHNSFFEKDTNGTIVNNNEKRRKNKRDKKRRKW